MSHVTRKVAAVGSAVASFLYATHAFAQTYVEEYAAPLTEECIVNGKSVPCEELGGAIGAMVAGIMIPILLVGLALFILWIVMLIHAATKPIENKALWIVVLVFTQGLGAVVYYFAVKRPFDKKHQAPMVPGSK